MRLPRLPRFFVDSSDPELIRHWFTRGATGVTTNPTIIAREMNFPEGLTFEERMSAVRLQVVEVFKAARGFPVSVQLTELDSLETILQEARLWHETLKMSNIDPKRLVVKVPFLGEDGSDNLLAIRSLSSGNNDSFSVNATCLMTADQAVLAIINGARYVSLFAGRIWEVGADPVEMMRYVRRIIETTDSDCEIIAGSIRQTDQVIKCWDAGFGAHIVTIPEKVLAKFGHNYGTIATTQEMMTSYRQAFDPDRS